MKRPIMNKIDRFCDKHPNFGLSNLMMYIITGSVAVYIFALLDSSGSFLYNLSFDYDAILHGQVWRLVTYVFLPIASSPFSFIISLYFYYMIGTILERTWGTAKFNFYYIFGVVLSSLYGMIICAVLDIGYLGLSSFYINMAMFFAYATLYPDNIVLLFFIIPIKIKWLAALDGFLFVYEILVNPFPINLLPLVAVLNYLIFCGGDLLYYGRQKHRANKTIFSKSSIHFREEARKAKKNVDSQPYRHKCAVCGRTDTEYPNLQFRYCSKCQGYHCFCEDHINNHIHFTE